MTIINQKILIVEDDLRTAHWMSVYLEQSGFSTIHAENGTQGLKLSRSEDPDLILLDINLPGLDGIELCRILRRENDIPLIMVTSRGTVEERISGLELGADDYVAKPFDPDELIARVGALLRRYRREVRQILSTGPLSLDEDTHKVFLDGEVLQLSHAQFSLLYAFMRHPDVVLTRDQLINQAFDNNFNGFNRSIDAHVKRLRKIIHRENFTPIQTVYGAGYRFKCL